jgi:hypothetical protein
MEEEEEELKASEKSCWSVDGQTNTKRERRREEGLKRVGGMIDAMMSGGWQSK